MRKKEDDYQLTRETLDEIFANVDDTIKDFISDQLDDFIFLSKKLEELKKLPFLIVHPDNKAKQRTTPAFREYKELKSQYNDVFKTLIKILLMSGSEEEDPVKIWLEERNSKDKM